MKKRTLSNLVGYGILASSALIGGVIGWRASQAIPQRDINQREIKTETLDTRGDQIFPYLFAGGLAFIAVALGKIPASRAVYRIDPENYAWFND